MRDEIIEQDDDEMEVELAGVGERIGAYCINQMLTGLAMVPLIIGFIASFVDKTSSGNGRMWLLMGLLVMVAYYAWQIYLMSKYGQSLGKRLLNIRVIKADGEEAGFVNVVLLRELVFNVGVGFGAGVFGGIVGGLGAPEVGSFLGGGAQIIASLACLVMLFAHSERRTLQDLIANTVVIKVPR